MLRDAVKDAERDAQRGMQGGCSKGCREGSVSDAVQAASMRGSVHQDYQAFSVINLFQFWCFILQSLFWFVGCIFQVCIYIGLRDLYPQDLCLVSQGGFPWKLKGCYYGYSL